MKNKGNFWNWMGLVVGIVVFLGGIVFFLKQPESYYTDWADKASFGSDYYTYQYEATRIVASNASVTANNIRELGVALSRYAGFFFMAMGMLIIIHYGKLCFIKNVPVTQADDNLVNRTECDKNQ